MVKRLRVLGVLVALGLTAAACGSDSDGPTTAAGGKTIQEGACTAERVGGKLSISALALGQSLDPYTVGGGSAQTALELVALYDSLLRFDEASGKFVGQLAESIEANDDASEWTLKLRKGTKFGNGDPLDATAVKASIDRYIDPEGESRMKSVGQFIKDVEVVDPLTVKIVLTQPWGFFPIHLSAGGGAVGALGMVTNVKLIEERGADAFGKDPSGGGAGPYEVKRWAPPEEVVLEAKKDWWGGPVCIEELRFLALSSGQARLDSLRTGELDMAIQYRDPIVADEAKAEFESVDSIYQSGQQLEMNHTNPELGDIRTRRAMALAIDPTVIDERAYGGAGLPGSGLVSEDAALLKGTKGLAYDPEEAKALVTELKGDGMDLKFELLLGDQAANVEAGLATKAMLDAAGFEITVRTVPTAQIIQAVYSERNFDLALGGQVGSEATLFASLARFNSKNPANPYGFKEPAFDAALDELREAVSVDELQAAIDDVQEQWNELVPAVVLASDEASLVFREGIKGVKFTRGITPFFDTAYLAD